MKKSRFFTVGILVLSLVFGLVLIGCGDKDSGDPTSPAGNGDPTPPAGNNGDSNNPFVGTWNGTVIYNMEMKAGTITFTATNWTLVCTEHSINETGTYTVVGGNGANLIQGGATPIGAVQISNNTLMGSFIAGTYTGASLTSFTK